jgi:hypothetical protein
MAPVYVYGHLVVGLKSVTESVWTTIQMGAYFGEDFK